MNDIPETRRSHKIKYTLFIVYALLLKQFEDY
jgi:hypothetical protein